MDQIMALFFFMIKNRRNTGASGKNVVWTVFPFAPQPFIRGKRTHVVALHAHTLEDYGLNIAVRLILPTVEISR
jgi:hypothetical protein